MYKADVYDFDGTIYNGDSSLDFFVFCLKKNKKTFKYIPKIVLGFIAYCLKIISTKKFKEIFFSIIKEFDIKSDIVNEFWDLNSTKINSFFIENVNKTKKIYVISASPEFLLRPYLSNFKNVSLIATKMDNKGKITGENCKGEYKVEKLYEKAKNIKIENFFSDSLSDLPLVELSENSYYVNKGEIFGWSTNDIKKSNNRKIGWYLFVFFSLFYMITGMLLSYNYDFSGTYDLLFDLDTARVISDMSDIFGNHYRLTVHPLFVLIYQPLYYVVHGFVLNKMLALIIISSFVTSISIMLLYRLLSLYSNKATIKILLVACYGFSFSNYIFTASIELYNIAAVVLIGLWYFVAEMLNRNNISKFDYFILIVLGILTMSITISNYVIFLICSLLLLISRKIKLRNIFVINILIIVSFLLLNGFQKCIWHNTPIFIDAIFSESNDEGNYIDLNVNLDKVKNVVKNDYYNSVLASDVYLNEYTANKMILFKNTSKLSILLVTLFLIQIMILLIRNFKKNAILNIGVLLSLLFNTGFHIFYGNGSTFLYSLHFLYLLIILCGVNLLSETDKKIIKITKIYLLLFVMVQIVINSFIFLKVLKICNNILGSHKLKIIMGLKKEFIFIVLLFLLLYILVWCTYRRIRKHNKIKIKEGRISNIILIFLIFIIIETIFVVLETIPVYEKILWKKIGLNSNDNVYIDQDYKIFKKKYKKEINSYFDYESEYKKFIDKYDCTLNYDLSNYEYFLFGLGNRKKLIFKENMLIDLETGESLYNFDVSNSIVIPNEYTVLLLTNDNKYVKIYENENGIYIKSDDNIKLIKGTDVKIKLFDFENQKYKNMKKVLYHEILFNIEDSVIYPNILVYDNPWYRDGAIASMVLKQTKNEDLISEWKIKNVYDKQNKGENETDNLGELLYILSVQGGNNSEMIKKIEEEAERIANENEKGNYIEGNTDFSPHARYQNMWYDFGMKSLGKTSKYEYKNLSDNYSATAWWSSDVLLGDRVGSSGTKDYPYLSWAQYHTNHSGVVFANASLYPLSWEKNASEAKYDGVNIINEFFEKNRISPTHTWTASEMLLFLLDETKDLKKLY